MKPEYTITVFKHGTSICEGASTGCPREGVEKPEYTITVFKHGITLSEGVPVSDLRGIMEEYGLKKGVASMRLAQKLGMALVFAKSVKAEQEWLKELEG